MDKQYALFDSFSSLYEGDEKKLDASYSGMLRLMCDNVPDLLWAKDLDRRFLFVNQAMCDKLLIAKDTVEPVGKTDMFFAERERKNHADHPDWHTFGEICRDSDSVVLETGKAGRFDEFGNVQGKFLFLDVYKAPFRDADGKILGTVGCGREVTNERRMIEALRKQEQEYHQIVDEAASLIMKIDLEGRIIFLNRYGRELIGCGDGDLSTSKAVGTVFPPISNTGLEMGAYLRKISRDPEEMETRAFMEEVLCGNGKRIYLSWTHRPLYDEQGNYYGLLCIGNDASDSRLRELELEEARDEAEASEAKKGVFLSTVVHELRTPLSGMIGLVDALMEKTREQELLEEISLIRGASRDLLSLVDDLLGFHELDLCKPKLQNDIFSLRRDLLYPVQRMMDPLVREKGLQFELSVEPSIPDAFFGDELRLRQMLFNLLGNAVKYTEHGKVSLHIERQYPLFSDENRLPLVFMVMDTGSGIPEDLKSSLFELFTRSRDKLQRRQVGSGLGLAIVKGLVDAFGGSIDFDSSLEYGTVFRVCIDLTLLNDDAKAGESPEREREARELSGFLDLKQLRPSILLVDDNRLHRVSIAWALREAGCRLMESGSGGHALRLARKDPPDLLISDLDLPDMSGREFVRELRVHIGFLPPAIGISAWLEEDDRQAVLNSGFSSVFIKPIPRQQLYTQISRILHQSREAEDHDAWEELSGSASGFIKKLLRADHEDRAYLMQMGLLFLEDMPKLIDQLFLYHQDKQIQSDELMKIVHSMKNYTGILGAGTVSRELYTLEDQLASGVLDPGRIERTAERLRNLHQLFADLMRQEGLH